jgi:hypothetical protein
MKSTRSKGLLERGAASDLWRNTLSQIHSVYGRLVFLSSLRDSNSGHYIHHGLAQLFGDSEADKALRTTHEEAFRDWLNYSLEQQKADLDLYLSGLRQNRKAVVETWLRLLPYRHVLPGSARDVEKVVFLSDFNALLTLMKNSFGADGPDPNA